ncbi:Zinc-type alcohol dehydrogenase-like protein [Colletotrichum shisoi]|uniref:Zinc-type alcohol dehydrogenase-like protein n=1 Tax=Colletotrichum shisoi TaxID=2078593 RepID=A0A5Q4BAD1_9PEZI|nr:Zinc-type alcohol dehydrogenase-like protein [Colletotrichum shisoi]
MPENLSYLEAGTLSCAPLTAWNVLYGLKPVAPGDWVLTQGTGGVSIAAVQFAKAAGARVIATTSSSAKAEARKKLGADHVINYKTNPSWESLKAAAIGGVIRAVDAFDIKPVIDQNIFKLEDLKEAYQYQWDQKQVGKTLIKIE